MLTVRRAGLGRCGVSNEWGPMKPPPREVGGVSGLWVGGTLHSAREMSTAMPTLPPLGDRTGTVVYCAR